MTETRSDGSPLIPPYRTYHGPFAPGDLPYAEQYDLWVHVRSGDIIHVPCPLDVPSRGDAGWRIAEVRARELATHGLLRAGTLYPAHTIERIDIRKADDAREQEIANE
jgi:hypothetical protein